MVVRSLYLPRVVIFTAMRERAARAALKIVVRALCVVTVCVRQVRAVCLAPKTVVFAPHVVMECVSLERVAKSAQVTAGDHAGRQEGVGVCP